MSLSPLLRRPYLSPLFCRFGAACTYSAASGTLFILGGVVKDRLLEHNEEVVECGAPFIDEDGDAGSLHRHVYRVTFAAPHAPRPLLVGHSVAAAYDDTTHFLCVGGGATCFSMGTHWNRGVYTLAASNSHGAPGHAGLWELEQTVDIAPARQAGQDGIGRHGAPAAENVEVEVTPVPRLKCASAGHFSQLVRQARPVILEELDLGPCLSTWSLESLARKVGHDREVKNRRDYGGGDD